MLITIKKVFRAMTIIAIIVKVIIKAMTIIVKIAKNS